MSFADLVITTSTHMNQLSSVVSNKEKLVQVVTAPSSPTVAKMAMIGGKSVGILCASETYSHIILRSMQNLELSCKNIETFLFGSAAHLDTFLRLIKMFSSSLTIFYCFAAVPKET